MYYVPDGTKECGYYECKKCGNRFLSMQTMKRIPCPDCEAEIDYEIGPDESLEDVLDTAELIQKIEGEEEVEKMDTLLSLALTGGDYSCIFQNYSGYFLLSDDLFYLMLQYEDNVFLLSQFRHCNSCSSEFLSPVDHIYFLCHIRQVNSIIKCCISTTKNCD